MLSAPAAFHAFMSVTACAALDADGPPGGMLPPYHVSRCEDVEVTHSAPFPVLYASLALLYPLWHCEQPPIVPDAM